MRAFPNMTVVQPADAVAAKALAHAAVESALHTTKFSLVLAISISS